MARPWSPNHGLLAEVIEAANDTVYGLACNVFSQNISRALRVAHALEAGTACVCTAHPWFRLLPERQYCRSIARKWSTTVFRSVGTSNQVSDASWASTPSIRESSPRKTISIMLTFAW